MGKDEGTTSALLCPRQRLLWVHVATGTVSGALINKARAGRENRACGWEGGGSETLQARDPSVQGIAHSPYTGPRPLAKGA